MIKPPNMNLWIYYFIGPVWAFFNMPEPYYKWQSLWITLYNLSWRGSMVGTQYSCDKSQIWLLFVHDPGTDFRYYYTAQCSVAYEKALAIFIKYCNCPFSCSPKLHEQTQCSLKCLRQYEMLWWDLLPPFSWSILSKDFTIPLPITGNI